MIPLDLMPSVCAAAARLQNALCEKSGAVASGILARDMLGLRLACGLPAPDPNGLRSHRGTARFLQFSDGWAVLNLARAGDHDLIAAFTQGEADCAAALSLWAKTKRARDVAADAWDLGLAFAAVPANPAPPRQPYLYRPSGLGLGGGPVVNLSGLWAGPLAGRILADAGMDVCWLQATSRPEAPQPEWAQRFTGLLRAGQRPVVVPHLAHVAARDRLARASVIITSSRGEGLARAGILPRPDQLWLRITAYGADAANARRVGYGDDVGAAAGGVRWSEDGTPRFQGDAFPDPLTGMLGAFGILQAIEGGQGGVVDVSLYDAAAWALAGGSDLP